MICTIFFREGVVLLLASCGVSRGTCVGDGDALRKESGQGQSQDGDGHCGHRLLTLDGARTVREEEWCGVS